MAAHLHRRLRLGQAGGLGDQIILVVEHQLPEGPIQRRHALLQLLRLRLCGGVALGQRAAGKRCGIERVVPEGSKPRAGEQLQRGAALARSGASPPHRGLLGACVGRDQGRDRLEGPMAACGGGGATAWAPGGTP